MGKITVEEILSSPGTDAEREEAIRHFFPELASEFDSAPVEKAVGQVDVATQNPYTVNAAPMVDSAKRFLGGAAEMLNPIEIAKGLGQMVAHPIETIVDPMSQNAVKAYDLAKEGRYSEAAGHAGASVIPIMGPMAAQIGEEIGRTGDVARGLGQATGMLAGGKILQKAPGVIKAIPERVRSSPAISEVAAIAKDAYGADIRAYRPTAGEAAISATAGVIGGPHVAAATYAALKIPKVLKAISKGRAARRGISEAKAHAEVLKMGEEALQKEVLEQKIHEGTGLPINPDGTVTVDIGGRKINLDPSRIQPKTGTARPESPTGPYLKPQEPGSVEARLAKEPPRAPGLPQEAMPAPEPPVTPAEAPAAPGRPNLSDPAVFNKIMEDRFGPDWAKHKPPEAKPVTSYRPGVAETARDVNRVIPSVSKGTLERMKHVLKRSQKKSPKAEFEAEKAARAARQKEHIAESYRKKAERDAKNVAEGEDLEGKLRASLKPKEAPAKQVSGPSDVHIAEHILSMFDRGLSPAQIRGVLREEYGIPNSDGAQLVNMVLEDLKKGK